jgi:hypothetical protein
VLRSRVRRWTRSHSQDHCQTVDSILVGSAMPVRAGVDEEQTDLVKAARGSETRARRLGQGVFEREDAGKESSRGKTWARSGYAGADGGPRGSLADTGRQAS